MQILFFFVLFAVSIVTPQSIWASTCGSEEWSVSQTEAGGWPIEDQEMAIGNLVITKTQIFWKKRKVTLAKTRKSTESSPPLKAILVGLVTNAGRPLTSQQLGKIGWPNHHPSLDLSNNVRVAISTIRASFVRADSKFGQLFTRHGVGYTWLED